MVEVAHQSERGRLTGEELQQRSTLDEMNDIRRVEYMDRLCTVKRHG